MMPSSAHIMFKNTCWMIGLLFVALFLSKPDFSKAASCQFDIESLALKSGKVTRISGDGVIISDGTDIILPEALLPYARLNQTLRVKGLAGVKEKQFWAVAVLLQNDEAVCPNVGDVRRGAQPGSNVYDVIIGGVRPTPPL